MARWPMRTCVLVLVFAIGACGAPAVRDALDAGDTADAGVESDAGAPCRPANVRYSARKQTCVARSPGNDGYGLTFALVNVGGPGTATIHMNCIVGDRGSQPVILGPYALAADSDATFTAAVGDRTMYGECGFAMFSASDGLATFRTDFADVVLVAGSGCVSGSGESDPAPTCKPAP